nr:hypothetical protein GCM10020092_072640 [Actinoplanes digitatis]
MEAFRTGLKQADEAYPYRNDTGALTARALLSCGVALVGRETADVDDALAALREARAVLTAPGAVLRALRLLAQLEGFVDDELLNRLRRATR